MPNFRHGGLKGKESPEKKKKDKNGEFTKCKF